MITICIKDNHYRTTPAIHGFRASDRHLLCVPRTIYSIYSEQGDTSALEYTAIKQGRKHLRIKGRFSYRPGRVLIRRRLYFNGRQHA